MRRRTNYAGSESHLQRLKDALRRQSARRWNRWRDEHPSLRPDLRGIILPGAWLAGFNLDRARLDNADLERTALVGGRLERASLRGASLDHANLANVHAAHANFSGAHMPHATCERGDFRRARFLDAAYMQHVNCRKADFTGAKLPGANLSEADLTRARFDGADLHGAELDEAVLDGTSFLGANLSEASVDGTFIRGVATDRTTNQSKLQVDMHIVGDRPRGEMVKLDEANDLRLAQFHDVVDEPGAVAYMISANVKRVVLILGRFLHRRKRVLDQLAGALRVRGKIPVIFDFPGPSERELSDTVRFIAAMSQFIVVDLTEASSVPLELQATIPDLMVPVLPIVKRGEGVFAMFSDLQRRYAWIQPTVSYANAAQLVRHVDKAIIDRAEAAAAQIAAVRQLSVSQPIDVARLARRPKPSAITRRES